MRKTLLAGGVAILALMSCKQPASDTNKELFTNYTEKQGPKIKLGDLVVINAIMRTDADSVIKNTYEKGFPWLFILTPPTFKGDLMDGLTNVAEGDSLRIRMPVDSIFRKKGRPANFNGNFVIAEIRVEKVFPKGNMTDSAVHKIGENYAKQLGQAALKVEPAKIQKYIANKKLNVTLADSGLYYTIIKKGEGPMAKPGDTVVMNYVGKTLTDRVFDTNVATYAPSRGLFNAGEKYEPIKIPVGNKNVIPGWNIGLKLLNKGATGLFILPSKIGFADMDVGFVGPFTPIVYQIELLDIIHQAKSK